MTKQHLIALDLDGTLLSDQKVISEKNKQILFRAMDEGHIVVIATGRPHRASIQYYKELGLKTPMVNFNGALIHHPEDSKWDALHNPMPKRTALSIVETCYNLDVHNVLAEVKDNVFLDKFDQNIIDIFHQTENDSPFTIGSLKSKLTEDPTSLLIHPKEDHIASLRDHLDDFHAEVIEHRKWGAPWNIIEIVKKGINKAVGLQKIAHYYQIPQERIIAFGDEDNDFEMIEYAGVGVAMGNAIDPLKNLAKHITDTNEANGISVFLEDYLKLEPSNVK
ncbi:Cof-type HAD-IIB family hydrolase [Ornithinibacillus xuwenensis]|uniref:Cof-type HAD-IIB family hydrolase n=1 Tax=Ornithinibacillus xuwenensis TaxID=3144668 RepID=A0ABU9XH96_9BACI